MNPRPLAHEEAPWPALRVSDGKVCRSIVAVYLAGYYLMYTPWVQLAWLLGAVLITAWKIDWRNMIRGMKRDLFIKSTAVFLGWMTLRSLPTTTGGIVAAVPWLGGLLWLVLFAAVLWQAAREPRALERVGAFVGAAAALAALVSLVLFYGVLPDHLAGERLANWFVYGGLNPVCTGLSFGFAALWIVCIKSQWDKPGTRALLTAAQVVLLLAVFFTRSRGALLALIAGHAVLLLARGWRKCWKDWLVLGLTLAVFQISGPVITSLAHEHADARAERVAIPRGFGSPMNEMLNRADSGRMEIYEAGIAALPDAKAWLFGIGQWGTEPRWQSHLQWREEEIPHHLHSAYLATLVHGGLVGLALLVLVLVLGTSRALVLAREGDNTWIILLAYGGVALLFDGQTFTRMNSLPLFEPLLVFFPMVAAASGRTPARSQPPA